MDYYNRNTDNNDEGVYGASYVNQSGNAVVESGPATSYSTSDMYAALASMRRKRRRKRAMLTVVGVILALLVAAGVAVGLYVNSVNDAMSLGDEGAEIRAALTPASLDEPFYMLLVGSDWRENSGVTDKYEMSGDRQRADVIVLARIDRKSGVITLLSIPRDTAYIKEDGTIVKLNELYNESRGVGIIKAVEQLTNKKINHYAEVYFSDFESLIDALGGIELNIPNELKGTDALTDEPIVIEAGKQTLTGKQALLFARERKSLEGNQDAARQSNIRTIIEAMMKKARKMPLNDMPSIIYNVAECIRTDFSFSEILLLAADFRSGVKMYNGSGPAAGDKDDAADGLWLCYEDPQGWERVMQIVDAGEDPSDVSYEGDIVTVAGTDQKLVIDKDGNGVPYEEPVAEEEYVEEY